MAADMIADQKDDLDPYTQRASELMVRELDRFESLLAELLEISRHDAGVADLSEDRIDIRTCVNAAWSQVQHLAEELNVEVSFNEPDEPVSVVVDSRRIERIMRNLIANAIDHSEGNPVEVTLAATDDAVAITVVDHGVGLKPGQEDLVFNRFWRADPSRKRHSGGIPGRRSNSRRLPRRNRNPWHWIMLPPDHSANSLGEIPVQPTATGRPRVGAAQ